MATTETENRKFGTFTFGANLDILKDAPLDTRTVVKTEASLFKSETWLAPNGDSYLYNGLVVAVTSTNNLFICVDKDNFLNKNAWKKLNHDIIDNLTSNSTVASLSANLGKIINTEINNLKDAIKGGMHFIGVFDNITLRDASIDAKVAGNVCLVGTKEYVWSGDSSTGSWIELGDETLLSNLIIDVSTLQDFKDNAINKLAEHEGDIIKLNKNVSTLNTDVSQLKTDISTRLSEISDNISTNSSLITDISTRLSEISFTYDTSLPDDLKMVDPIGGYVKNTSVESLKGKKIIDIIDDLLFPTVNPSITEPSVTLSLKSNYKNILEINTAAPNTSNFTVTNNRGSIKIGTSEQAKRAGEDFDCIIYYGNNVSNGLLTTLPTTPQTVLYNAITTFLDGPQPLDSKGNPYGTPFSSSTKTSNGVSIYVVYPFFANETLNTSINKLALTSSTSFLVTLAAENPNKHIIKIPYNITKVEAWNELAGKFEDFDVSKFTKTAETIKINNVSVNYNVYTRNDNGFSGQTEFKITYSKS